MNILVLQPTRPNHPPALREVAASLLSRMVEANPWMSFDVRIDDAALEIPAHPSIYMKHATVRNYMLDKYLKREHDRVLWVDSDLIDYPPDLPTRLMKVAARYPDPGAIVAPLALLSETSGHKRRFYDIGGFVEQRVRARMYPPYFYQEGEVIELDSVGCCYLVPARLYKSGVRYEPPPTDYYVEHWSVMTLARLQRYKVCCLTTVAVTHAWMPDYGMEPN